MFTVKKDFKRLDPIIYPENISEQDKLHFGYENRLYRSLNRLFEAFWIYNKKELYLVGGVVRDLLLGKEPKDYDLTTSASIEEIREICAGLNLKTFDSGVKHGTLTIIEDFYKISYECTVYRKDGELWSFLKARQVGQSRRIKYYAGYIFVFASTSTRCITVYPYPKESEKITS